LLLATVTAALSACSGGGGGEGPGFTGVNKGSPQNCIATLTWEAPTERLNGTPLVLQELKNFTIYAAKTPDVHYDQRIFEIEINDVFLTTFEVKDLKNGSYWFYMTVTDLQENTSTYSNVQQKVCNQA
jgi:hypothetical protein